MKNPLLESLINDIILLGEAGKTPQQKDVVPKGLFPGVGGNYYSDKELTQYAGKVVGRGTNRKWVPKEQEPATQPTDKKVQTTKQQGATTQQEKPSGTQTTVDVTSLEKVISRVPQGPRREVMQSLLTALQSGNAQQVQSIIDQHKIYISPEGKLKSATLGTKSDEQKLLGDKKDLARQFYDLAKSLGVEIPGSGDRADTEVERPTSSTEQYKPSQTFSDKEPDKLDLELTDTGINVEGIEIPNISQEQEQVIEDDLVNRARERAQEKGQQFTSVNEERVRQYVRKRIAATRHNIRYLRALSESGESLQAHQFQGDEGRERIVGRLTEVITRNVPEEKRQVIQASIEKMGSAKSVKEFNSAYEEFAKLLKGTDANKGKKYLAETITALRVVALGGTALIPTSDSFPLADVLALKHSPITGEVDIDQILVDIDEEQEITAAGSVKDGNGAASGNKPKIQNSRFNTGEVDGVDCSAVQEDLSGMCDMRREIFTATQDGDVSPEAKKKLVEYISKYGPMIKAYYGLGSEMNDEDLYMFLSYGKELVCVDGTPQPTPDGLNGTPYKQGQSANGGQWRAWSVLGKITDAIHNRTVEQQYYHTVRYNGVITVADGIRTLSKMKAQHLKNAAPIRGTEGFTRPDQELNAFTVPASIEEVRNGNPCEE